MINNSERSYPILYDNSIYRSLTRKGNEKFSETFFNSLNSYIPDFYNNFYGVYFSSASFLEAIGDGNFREKHAKNLDLTPFLLTNLDIDQTAIKKKIENLLDFSYDFFYLHEGFSEDSLLKKIDDQLNFSTTNDTNFLVTDTLVRYKQKVITDYESVRERLVDDLSWDLICGFPFARLSSIREDDQESIRIKIRKINESLIEFFHDQHCNGKKLSFHRLADKIQRELLTTKPWIGKIEQENSSKKLKILVIGMLESELKDLGDVNYIDFATLGLDGKAGIILTGDSREVIETRLSIQLSVLQFALKFEGSKLELFLGEIYIVDHKTGLVKEKILVSEIKENARIKIKIDKLTSGISSILVFNK